MSKLLSDSLLLMYFEALRKVLFSEYFLWLIAGFAVAARFFIAYSRAPALVYISIEEHYFELLLGALVALFPFVFYQIFGKSPLHAIRDRQADGENKNIFIHGNGNVIQVAKDKAVTEGGEEAQGTAQLLFQLAKNAEVLSNKIYVRSGVYLIFGVLIAFSGIAYFSLQSISIATPQTTDISTQLIALAPRFGVLFFIEFIAFFFLKQYRAAMDEFRHYDAIKRNRESQLAIFLMATKEFPEKSFVTVVDKTNFFEYIGRLASGETTELLESNKQNKNEIEGIKDLLSELIKKVKPTEKPGGS
jgi:hypothetical protein